jgi:hypothetical protein
VTLAWSLPPLVGLPTIRLRMRPQDRMRGTRRYRARSCDQPVPIPDTPPFIAAGVSASVRRRSVVSDTPTQSFAPAFGFSFLINYLR